MKFNNIALLTWGDANSKETWSKTPYQLLQMLQERSFSVYNINIDGFTKPWQRKYRFLLHKLGALGESKLPGLFGFYSKKVHDELDKNDTNTACLFACANCLNRSLKINNKSFIYIDAVVRPMYMSRKIDFIRGIVRKFSLGFYEYCDRTTYSFAAKIFTQNEWTRQYLVDHYHVSDNKVINVGFGVNLNFFEGEKDFSKELLLIVLRKGKDIEAIKGLPLLLKAFRLAKQSNPKLRLAVVGTTGEPEEGVEYYYGKSRETTIRLFQDCTLYTMPALSEPNGITYLEALANKTPILGLDRYSVPEFSGYGKYGFYTSDATPEGVSALILKALSDKAKLKRMGEEGQLFVRSKYCWDKVVDKMLSIINNEF